MLWTLYIVSSLLTYDDYFSAGLVSLFFAGVIRKGFTEESYAKDFLEKNRSTITTVKTISMILGISILLIVLYDILTQDYVMLSDRVFMGWLIFIILLPVILILLKYELGLSIKIIRERNQ